MSKFASTGLAIAITSSVLLVGCTDGSNHGSEDYALTQNRLADYCGIDLDKMREDLKRENPSIMDVQIIDTDCKTRISYREADGDREHVDLDNDSLMPLLAMGGMAALAGYALGNSGDRDHYRDRIRRRDRDGGMAYAGGYVTNNSRAAASYRTGNKASRINVSSSTGTVSTRSNAFRGTSSVARSSSYSGG